MCCAVDGKIGNYLKMLVWLTKSSTAKYYKLFIIFLAETFDTKSIISLNSNIKCYKKYNKIGKHLL